MTATRRVKTTATPATPAGAKKFSLISDEKLLEIYTAMVKCRMAAERLSARGKRRKATDAAAGREAMLAGVSADLTAEDAMSLCATDAVAGILKGQPPAELLRPLRAQAKGRGAAQASTRTSGDLARHILPVAAGTAAQLRMACGVALAWKMKMPGRIVAAFCGKGSAPAECWNETLQFAGQHQLPMLFVCHDGGRGTGARATAGRFEAMAQGAKASRVPVFTVDGNDAVAVYRVAFESMARARQGRGPTLIECRTGVGAGPAGGTKSARREEAADPLLHMEDYLASKGLLHADLKRRIADGVRRELNSASRFLRN